MTYKEIVTVVKNISEAINPGGSFFHGRNYDTTLEFGAVYPQIHLYPFTMQPEQSNYNIIRSELLIAFWEEDGHENTMQQREDIIAAMDDLCVLFEAAIRATENVQVLSFRKEPQYLSQMGVVSGIACNISLHSAVLCAGPTTQAPINLTLPLITGLNTLGATLSGSNGTWSGNPDTFTYTYQWKRNGVNISGATNNTYVTTILDSEADITFEVTANNGISPNGVATSLTVTMADYTPVNTLAPVISGLLELGEILTSTNGTWTNSPNIFTYQWLRNGIEILGATSSTYALTLGDQETNITLVVSASNGLVGTQISNTIAVPSFAIPPVFTVAPQITGTAVVGQTLTCDGGTVTGTPTPIKTYQWYRGVTPISGATSSTYTLVQADAGNTSNIKCVVTATNSAGSASADSNTVAQIFDATWWDFSQSLSITDTTINNAMNTYTITRKSISATASLGAYPFVGGTDVTHSRNLYNAADTDAAKRIVWSGTITHNTNGVQGNGVNGTGDTKINSSTDFASNDFTIAWVSKTNQTRVESEMGSMGSAAAGLGIEIRTTGANCITSAQGASVNSGSGIVSDTSGVFIFKREGTTVTLRRNNVLIFTRTDATNTKINQTINIISRRYLGSIERYSSKLYGHFEFIGIALDSTQETNLYNALAAKETALGR